ncbi:MAG: TonB-dependent receptor plug domain-containing protein [Sphingomonas sp.]
MAIATSLLSVTAAHAQSSASAESADGGVEEIVVTASKRETRLQDVPAAISVVSGEAIETTQSFSLESFTRLDPSIQVNNRGVGDNQIIVRGVSSSGKPHGRPIL